jgi:hypothetical protein
MSNVPNTTTLPDSLSAAAVRRIMRQHRVTIRKLASALHITQKRVREVRCRGVCGPMYVWDWIEAITGEREGAVVALIAWRLHKQDLAARLRTRRFAAR